MLDSLSSLLEILPHPLHNSPVGHKTKDMDAKSLQQDCDPKRQVLTLSRILTLHKAQRVFFSLEVSQECLRRPTPFTERERGHSRSRRVF